MMGELLVAALLAVPIAQQMHLPTRGLHYRIVITGPRVGLLGLTDTGTRTISLYLQPGEPAELVRKVLAYEVAHAVDVVRLTDSDRAAWLRARGAPMGESWWAPNRAPEAAYGSGDFADCFSLWATGSPAYWHSVLPIPSRTQMRALARYFTPARRAHA